MMRAFGADPSVVGIRRDMLGASDARLYSLFDGSETDQYERSESAKEEQMLAFLLASERGVTGELMSRFRRRFGRRAKGSRRRLVEKFMTLYPPGTVPVELRENLLDVLKDAVSPGK
jgi:hypothetical protein